MHLDSSMPLCACGCGESVRQPTQRWITHHNLGAQGLPRIGATALNRRLEPMRVMRFWRRVVPQDGCWDWQGTRDRFGYGHLTFRGRSWRAYRLAYTLAYGPIPPGMHVLHSCDHPPCCRPSHLRLGTPADNSADKVARGRITRVPGERCGKAKLTWVIVRTMRERAAQGESYVLLAREYGVARCTVAGIIQGRRWVVE